MVSLCLRFDHHNAGYPSGLNFPKPYFITSLIFYFAGLVTTMAVMHIYKAAQPALLYLSPAGIISVFLTALVRGELKVMWAYSTEEEVLPEDESETETSSKGSSTKKTPTKTRRTKFD